MARHLWVCAGLHASTPATDDFKAENCRVRTSFWLGKNSKLDPFCFESCWHSAFTAGYLQIWSVFSEMGEKDTTSQTATHLKTSELEIHVFFTKWRNILVLRLTKRLQGCLVLPAMCTEHRFAKMSTRRWWAIIPRALNLFRLCDLVFTFHLWMNPNKRKSDEGSRGTGVTCDPTYRSPATLPP